MSDKHVYRFSFRCPLQPVVEKTENILKEVKGLFVGDIPIGIEIEELYSRNVATNIIISVPQKTPMKFDKSITAEEGGEEVKEAIKKALSRNPKNSFGCKKGGIIDMTIFTISDKKGKGQPVLKTGRVTNCESLRDGFKLTVEHDPGELAVVRAELNEIFGVANVVLYA
jgi:hypothetical protein